MRLPDMTMHRSRPGMWPIQPTQLTLRKLLRSRGTARMISADLLAARSESHTFITEPIKRFSFSPGSSTAIVVACRTARRPFRPLPNGAEIFLHFWDHPLELQIHAMDSQCCKDRFLILRQLRWLEAKPAGFLSPTTRFRFRAQ